MIEFINYIILFLILFYFLIASIEDIKKREVYDYINYSLSFFIIISGIFQSMVINSIEPIKYIVFGLLIGFFIGSILYYLGIWGGGDAKFLIGFSSASFYLIHFTKRNTEFELIYNILISKLKILFSLFLENFLIIIKYLDIIFIILSLGLLFFKLKNIKKYPRKEIKNLINLNVILLFLFNGIFLSNQPFILIIIGLISFILIFFSDDNLFNSIYFPIKKFKYELKEGDILKKNIFIQNKKLINQEENPFLELRTKEINIINQKFNENKIFEIKKILPYSMLIILNFTLYIFKIINIDSINIEILGFMLKFLLISFLVGGIMTIGILIFKGIINYKKIKIKIKSLTKIILISSSTLILILSIINIKFLILILIPVTYLILIITKEIEKIAFIKKKDLNKIVPGDWIVEDIIINKTKIFSKEDFKLGIDENQLTEIKKLAQKYPKLNKIYVKDGIAFLPPLFIGFIILLLL